MKIRYFHILSILLLFVTTFGAARAEDNDDDLLAEFAVDLMLGVGMAVCESSESCSAVMAIMGMITVMMTLVLLCLGEIDIGDICNRRTTRRGFTAGVGYSIGRSLRR